MLREAGLEGRVRIGLPTPPGLPGPLPPAVPPGAEEGFTPDLLLRPLARPAEGKLIELVGALSSGRTALACRMPAGATARGELVGWVDLPDALDPRSLQRCGAELCSVLWVRPPRALIAVRAAELLLKAGLGLVVLDLERAAEDSRPRSDERLGPAIWVRLARAARAGRDRPLLLAAGRRAGAHAALGLEVERTAARFESGLLEGLDARLRVTRSREPSDFRSPAFRLHHRDQTAEARRRAATSTPEAPSFS